MAQMPYFIILRGLCSVFESSITLSVVPVSAEQTCHTNSWLKGDSRKF